MPLSKQTSDDLQRVIEIFDQARVHGDEFDRRDALFNIIDNVCVSKERRDALMRWLSLKWWGPQYGGQSCETRVSVMITGGVAFPEYAMSKKKIMAALRAAAKTKKRDATA